MIISSNLLVIKICMGNVTEKSSHFKKVSGIVHGVHHGPDKWVTDKVEGTLKWHQNSLFVKKLIIQWESTGQLNQRQNDGTNSDLSNGLRILQKINVQKNSEEEISFVLSSLDCVTEDNPNGEILVHTKSRYEKVTTIDREHMPGSLMDFVKINKKSVEKNSDIEMIELELKPLFPGEKLPISNAYIRYCLK